MCNTDTTTPHLHKDSCCSLNQKLEGLIQCSQKAADKMTTNQGQTQMLPWSVLPADTEIWRPQAHWHPCCTVYLDISQQRSGLSMERTLQRCQTWQSMQAKYCRPESTTTQLIRNGNSPVPAALLMPVFSNGSLLAYQLIISYGQNVESAPFLTLALPRGTLYRKTCMLFLTVCFLESD